MRYQIQGVALFTPSLHPMKNLTLLFVLLLLCNYSIGQSTKEKGRISYSRVGLFYETEMLGNGENNGTTLGFELSFNPTYGDYRPEERFNLGWSLNLLMGWNFEGQNLGPYRYDIGIWGGYLINEHIEVGAQYCFLGAYAYQNASAFGSSLNPAVKVGPVQLIWYRAGAGAFYGWFIPKYASEQSTANGFELSSDFFKGLIIGGRINTYERGGNRSNEVRFFAAINMGEYFRPDRVRW